MGAAARSERKILVSAGDGVGRITLNNVAKLNAIDRSMWDDLRAAIQKFEDDTAVRSVVLCGAGERAFSSGADISEFADRLNDDPFQEDYDRRVDAAVAALNGFSKPLIGEIPGYCVGGGFYLALACDVRFATPKSVFSITGAKLGLGYSHAIIGGLVDLVGPARTADIMFTARQIGGEEAAGMGLVNFVVDDTDLEASAMDYARTIAGNAPMAVRTSKLTIAECCKDAAARDLDRIDRAVRECMKSRDAAEGVRAFVERRLPQFEGR